MDQRNSFPLLVHKICEGLQWCLSPTNFMITLHYNINDNNNNMPNAYINGVLLFTKLAIKVNKWNGKFTSNTKMINYLQLVYSFNDQSKYIYHSGMFSYLYVFTVYL